jgi:hypothetical protein
MHRRSGPAVVCVAANVAPHQGAPDCAQTLSRQLERVGLGAVADGPTLATQWGAKAPQLQAGTVRHSRLGCKGPAAAGWCQIGKPIRPMGASQTIIVRPCARRLVVAFSSRDHWCNCEASPTCHDAAGAHVSRTPCTLEECSRRAKSILDAAPCTAAEAALAQRDFLDATTLLSWLRTTRRTRQAD